MTAKQMQESIAADDRQIDGLIKAFEAEHKTVSTLAASVVAHDDQIEALTVDIKALAVSAAARAKEIEANNRAISKLIEAVDENRVQIKELWRQL